MGSPQARSPMGEAYPANTIKAPYIPLSVFTIPKKSPQKTIFICTSQNNSLPLRSIID